ncbi:MAG TPA: DUF309 domain-containing protein [Mycobacteriales bacterium]|nr:DUF309 domain-containing protein [Mycobacteriales bacterium]
MSPRAARGRDAAGRPVPAGSPAEVEPVPEVDRTPDEALALAQRLLDDGRPFWAHDVLEAAWKAAGSTGAGEPERALWQGLAQVCVGLTHVQRDNPRGAARLLRRGAGRLREAEPRHGVDPLAVAGQADRLADAVEAGAPPSRLQLRR